MKAIPASSLVLITACFALPAAETPARPEEVSSSVCGYASIQEAIDANPGRMMYVPAGEYPVEHALHITTNDTGLYGPGTIVQNNPDENILEIERTRGVRIEGLTLTRPATQQETLRHGLVVRDSEDIDLEGLRIRDNRSTAASLLLEHCRHAAVRRCSIANYKRIGMDDRTTSELYGYAFRVIDGTGIAVTRSRGVLIQDNRIIEMIIYPTEETKEKHRLGELMEGERPMKKGRLAPEGDYANNWHQGSAIVVTDPLETAHVLISGNYIENAAQGIDIHADHVTCAHNVIAYAFIGIKCMHGSRNVIISNNNVSHNDLWGLVMMPGTASHPAEAARNGAPARPANYTSGNIIAGNIFSDFGFGYEHHNWKDAKSGVISLESGQLPENPVMTDVLIEGNIVYDSGKDEVLVEGVPTRVPPRYEYAVYITPDPKPQGLRFSHNIFHPGRGGISNVPFEP